MNLKVEDKFLVLQTVQTEVKESLQFILSGEVIGKRGAKDGTRY